MSISVEIGLKVSKFCIRQQASLFRVTHNLQTYAPAARTQVLRVTEPWGNRVFPSVFSAPRFLRWFSSQNPGYSVVSGSSDEDMLFKEQFDAEQSEKRKLVLYSKPGCCLCDALKEKLQLAFMLRGDHDLSDVELEVRDITTNEGWEKAYQYEIPVLARLRADDSQDFIPRFSPRLTVEQLQKKLSGALDSSK